MSKYGMVVNANTYCVNLQPGADAARREVAALLVQALEAAEADRRTAQAVPQHVLAQQVYRKLQYDFPQVNEQELEALEMEFRHALDQGSLPSSYAITQQLLSNIVDGAMGSTTQGTAARPARPEPAGAISEQSQPTESPTTEATGLQALTKDDGAHGYSDDLMPRQIKSKRARAQKCLSPSRSYTSYQRVCAVLLVKGFRKLLKLPPAEVNAALATLRIEPIRSDPEQSETRPQDGPWSDDQDGVMAATLDALSLAHNSDASMG
eukprot:1190955-Prorocentrum_minimum.AAC.4